MPKQPRGKGVQIYIRDEDRAIIKAAAERDGRSMSNYIVMAARKMAKGEVFKINNPQGATTRLSGPPAMPVEENNNANSSSE